jgi:hypothetical protein
VTSRGGYGGAPGPCRGEAGQGPGRSRPGSLGAARAVQAGGGLGAELV